MKIFISKYAGFCYGVDRAIKMINQLPQETLKPIRMLGDLVHNEQVVERLKKNGIEVINSIDDIKNGTLIISAHGIDPKIIKKAKSRGLNIINTTCPMVLKPHQLVKVLEKQGYQVIIFGDKDHIEVQGIAAEVEGRARVLTFKELEDFPWKNFKKIGIVSQTTQNVEDFKKFIEYVKLKCEDVKIFNTICNSTRGRQEDIKKLACENEVILVIGSKTSANTKRLYEVARKINAKTYFVQDSAELKKEWFKNVDSVGVSAGASTPREVIEEVIKIVKLLNG